LRFSIASTLLLRPTLGYADAGHRADLEKRFQGVGAEMLRQQVDIDCSLLARVDAGEVLIADLVAFSLEDLSRNCSSRVLRVLISARTSASWSTG
jgi:hypothetical protein